MPTITRSPHPDAVRFRQALLARGLRLSEWAASHGVKHPVVSRVLAGYKGDGGSARISKLVAAFAKRHGP